MNFKLVTVAALLGLSQAAQLHAKHSDIEAPTKAAWGFLSDGENDDPEAIEVPIKAIKFIGEQVSELFNGKNFKT